MTSFESESSLTETDQLNKEIRELRFSNYIPGTDQFIRNDIILQFKSKILEVLDPSKAEEDEVLEKKVYRRRVERIKILKPEIEQFMYDVSQSFTTSDQTTIFNAMIEAFTAHIDIEKNRDEGQSYIGHILEVAQRTLENTKSHSERKKLVITALFHDIIEDNPEYFANTIYQLERAKKDIEIWALNRIKAKLRGSDSESEKMADTVFQALRIITKPNFEKLIDAEIDLGRKASRQKIKNELYAEYIKYVNKNEIASTVKYFDFEVNGIEILERLPLQKNKQTQARKHNRMQKYYRVFPLFIKVFEEIESEFPLYKDRESFLEKLKNAEQKYEQYFDERGINYKKN